jgi:nucleotide sugar dehydrogenase
MDKVVVVGQGYVGLPVAMRAVEAGYDVVGLDSDTERVVRLARGESYVGDVTDASLRAALATGRYRATDDYEAAQGFRYAVITVPTPLRDCAPDLSFIEASSRGLSRFVTPGATVVLESTTYPGTTDTFVRDLLEAGSGLVAGVDFYLGYSPERIDPGNPQWNFVNTPKLVSGINEASLQAIERFYGTLVERTIPVAGTREAETAKLLENTFRHVNIALVNELSIVARQLGVDLTEAIDAASTKPFGFMPFHPGPGVGGHCLPIDPTYLSWEARRTAGRPVRFVELANEVNTSMPAYVVQRLIETLSRRGQGLRGAEVLVLGLAYKKNSGDCRESPALVVARLLTSYGATVRAVDRHVLPVSVPEYVTMVALDADEVARTDVVLVLTDHDDVDYELLADARLVFDTRNRVKLGEIERL